MPHTWALQEAKNRFSELVEQALHDGPQIVTRRGKDTVVVLSVEAFHALTATPESLVAFLRQSPLAGVELDLERRPDYGREVAL
ncbi:MAG: type II toxin-antitoxin system Phd/YefM family antitoxin [Candidatus Tectimicrobiota bacterium]